MSCTGYKVVRDDFTDYGYPGFGGMPILSFAPAGPVSTPASLSTDL